MGTDFYQNVFPIFGVWVRDTVISTWVMIALVVTAILVLRRRFPTLLEMLIEFLDETLTDVLGRPAAPFLPVLGALAIFIAVANVVGVIPIVTTPTSDINTPLALALVVFFSVHFFGIREKGLMGYLKSLASPVFMLPLEIIGQLSRTLSLTLRLFGNIISTELVVAVIFSLIPLFVPLPVIGFSMFTGLLQAYIFTVLAAVYIGSALESER